MFLKCEKNTHLIFELLQRDDEKKMNFLLIYSFKPRITSHLGGLYMKQRTQSQVIGIKWWRHRLRVNINTLIISSSFSWDAISRNLFRSFEGYLRVYMHSCYVMWRLFAVSGDWESRALSHMITLPECLLCSEACSGLSVDTHNWLL